MIARLYYADGRVISHKFQHAPEEIEALRGRTATFRRTNDVYNGELVYREVVREATE